MPALPEKVGGILAQVNDRITSVLLQKYGAVDIFPLLFPPFFP